MKFYILKRNNTVRMCREDYVEPNSKVIYLVDTITRERIVMSEERLRAITLKEFESTNEFGPLVELKREHEKARYSDAVKHFNALCAYLNEIDDSTPIIAALAIIQDFFEQKERESAWE